MPNSPLRHLSNRAAAGDSGAVQRPLRGDRETHSVVADRDAAEQMSRKATPVDNCVCEAFNGSLRRECLSQHWFATLAEAQLVLDAWRKDYNDHRPHTTLGLQSPAVYRRAGIFEPRSVRAIN